MVQKVLGTISGFSTRYRSIHSQYRDELVAFRTKTNLVRMEVFSVLTFVVSLSVIFFVKPRIEAVIALFYILMGFAVILFFSSCFLRSCFLRDRERVKPKLLQCGFVHTGVILLVGWGTLQVFYGEGDPRAYLTYIGLMIAVAAVFSLEPFFYFLLGLLSFASLYLLPLVFDGLAVEGGDFYFPFLINSLVFGWVVALLHYFTVVEVFFVKKQMEEEGKKAELALTGGNLGYWNWDIERERIEVDGRWLAMLGYEPRRSSFTFDQFFRLVVPEDRKRVAETVQSYFDGTSDQYTITFRMETKSGEEKWIYAEGAVTEWANDGKPLFMHGIHQDVQELRDQQRKLQESEIRFRAYTENSPVGVFIIQGLRFTYVNPEAIHITGYTEDELLESVNLYTLIHPDERKKLKEDLKEILRGRETKKTYLYRIVSKNGDVHWFETRVSTVNWKKRMFLLSAVEVTERIQAEEKLKEHATYDELTGVFNRRVGIALLEKEMVRVHRDGSRFTVCFIDVNGLKIVNDTYGHEEGDLLIRTVVEVVAKVMRSGDILCRLGGDEFLLIFRDCGMEDAEKIKGRMDERLEAINNSDGRRYEVSVSYGLLEFDEKMDYSVQDLIHRADQLMYEDKTARKAQRASREPSE